MRWFLPLLFSVLLLHASDAGRLFELYQSGKYREACDEGVKHLSRHKKDEKYISLYAFSCLKSDRIDRLALPIIMLKKSRESRKNAAYFSIILMQKNLLMTALEDDAPLQDLVLPTTDYVLSKVFDLYSRGGHAGEDGKYAFTDPGNKRQTYRLYLRKGGERATIIVEEYFDTILTKRHTYR